MWQAKPTAPARAMNGNSGGAALAVRPMPQPKVRAQSADPVPSEPVRLTLPSPETLGIAPVRTAAAPIARPENWNDVHARLRRLSPTSFRIDQILPGQWRATLTLAPDARGARTFEADAPSDLGAVANVLAEAEAVVAAR